MSLGLYFHIPFCLSRCRYCHFISMRHDAATARRYVRALIREVVENSHPLDAVAVDSIYFGGGTPSLLPAKGISSILEACRARFRIAEDCEITLESNPETLTQAATDDLRKAGITRVSMGAQSFQNEELAVLGRRHAADAVSCAVRRLRQSGFDNVNLDMMLGIPLQTSESWHRSLTEVHRLGVEHVSVYMLDLDTACPLADLVSAGTVRLPDEDAVADLYAETVALLDSRGFRQYEISNFARDGRKSRHNLKYWERRPVLGFGAGSHSFDEKTRFSNEEEIGTYCRLVETTGNAVVQRESIRPDRAIAETLFLSLRLTDGVDWDWLRKIEGREALDRFKPDIDAFCARGWMQWHGCRLKLTVSGMLLSNEIFQVFV